MITGRRLNHENDAYLLGLAQNMFIQKRSRSALKVAYKGLSVLCDTHQIEMFISCAQIIAESLRELTPSKGSAYVWHLEKTAQIAFLHGKPDTKMLQTLLSKLTMLYEHFETDPKALDGLMRCVLMCIETLDFPVDAEYIVFLLQSVFPYVLHENDIQAERCILEAERQLRRLTGVDSAIAELSQPYWAFIYMFQDNMALCVQSVGRAGAYLQQLTEDLVDCHPIYEWLLKNRKQFLFLNGICLYEAIKKIWGKHEIEQVFDIHYIINNEKLYLKKASIILQEKQWPTSCIFFFKQLLEDIKALNRDQLQYINAYNEWQQQLSNEMNNLQKFTSAQKARIVEEIIQRSYAILSFSAEDSLFHILCQASHNNILQIATEGFTKEGLPDKSDRAAEMYLHSQRGDTPTDLLFRCHSCLNQFERGENEQALKSFQKIMNVQNSYIAQFHYMYTERDQIQFLSNFDLLRATIAYLAFRLLSVDAFYTYLLDTTHLIAMNRIGSQKASFTRNTKTIQKHLLPNAILVEFTWVRAPGEDRCIAVRVTKDWIDTVDLGSNESFSKYINALIKIIQTHSALLYSKAAIDIYTHFVKPLFSGLADQYQSLVIIPEGILYQIPFELLPLNADANCFLIDRYEISYMSSGRDVLSKRRRTASYDVLIQGVEAFIKDGKNIEDPLPFTRYESMRIAQIFRVAPYLNEQAKKHNLKKQARIIHFATHAYRHPEYKQKLAGRQVRHANVDQLLGLYLGDTEVITAEEIAKMNLARTELVVLSVCYDTQDAATYSEMLPGLRRAFHVAQAHGVIVSLFVAPDVSTMLLMIWFYEFLICKGMSISKALHQAKRKLQKATVSMLKPLFEEISSLGLGGEAITKYLLDSKTPPLERPFEEYQYWGGFIFMKF